MLMVLTVSSIDRTDASCYCVANGPGFNFRDGAGFSPYCNYGLFGNNYNGANNDCASYCATVAPASDIPSCADCCICCCGNQYGNGYFPGAGLCLTTTATIRTTTTTTATIGTTTTTTATTPTTSNGDCKLTYVTQLFHYFFCFFPTYRNGSLLQN